MRSASTCMDAMTSDIQARGCCWKTASGKAAAGTSRNSIGTALEQMNRFYWRGCECSAHQSVSACILCGAHPAELRLVFVCRRRLGSGPERREEALLRVLDEGERYPAPEGLGVSTPLVMA